MVATCRRYSYIPIDTLHLLPSSIDCRKGRVSRQRGRIEKHDAAWHIENACTRQCVTELSVIVACVPFRQIWGNLAFHRTVRHRHKPALRDYEGHAPVSQQFCSLVV